jgi:hypothetical protein
MEHGMDWFEKKYGRGGPVPGTNGAHGANSPPER